MTTQRSLIARFFGGAWRFVDGLRKLVLNLVFLLILWVVVMALIESGDTLIVEPDTALVLRPYGNVVEQFSGTPLDIALEQATQTTRSETRLRDLVQSVRRAKDDDKISRLVIDPNYLWRIGLASLQELEAAIQEFRDSGKPVVALVDNVGQQQYYLAAMADEIWMNPSGMIWIDGFAAYRQFFAEGLEKLEVEVNLFRVGEYKSAMEPWVRNDMSPEAEEANLYWIGGLWQQYLETVSRHRGIPLDVLSGAINDFAAGLDAVDGNFARFALELGLVDRLMDRPQANHELAQRGAPGDGSDGFRQIGFENYLAVTDLQPGAAAANKVVVVVAEGDIMRGAQPQGMVGAESLTDRLRAVAGDREASAVVLRINSPGGEVFASEKIRREVQALQETGKTVVVSMGDIAASGGYWIAMAADEVWALPTTITGSIGVYGILPTFSRPLEKLGIRSDGVGTTPLAGKLRLDQPLDPELRRIFQHSTERTYEEFLALVSDARGMNESEVHEVARGRVWNGSQALKRGLVDKTGTLQNAVDSAARIAGLGSDYEVVYDEREISGFESLLIQLTGNALAAAGLNDTGLKVLRSTMVEDILADLDRLVRSAGGFSVAAHCLCRVD
jgi:protease-4